MARQTAIDNLVSSKTLSSSQLGCWKGDFNPAILRRKETTSHLEQCNQEYDFDCCQQGKQHTFLSNSPIFSSLSSVIASSSFAFSLHPLCSTISSPSLQSSPSLPILCLSHLSVAEANLQFPSSVDLSQHRFQ